MRSATRRAAERRTPAARRPEFQPLPELAFPESLPVSGRRDDIAAAIREHPVVIVCGETGSGKTTQLPKICALAGRGRHGLIGHTQPRRLAATSVARRIAEELGSPLGVHVGYKIRFNEALAPGASIKLMTDGILLAESQADPLLSQYDTIIVDEAHERSLNIDFLLGYLKQLVEGPRRDDLKLVITSATIDAQRFAEHFGAPGRPAPVIEVSGRLYPVQVRWCPPAQPAHEDEDDETDTPSRIQDALEALWRERPGDVLVFLPGEREIRDVADHLRRSHARAQSQRGSPLNGPLEVLPLYSRLSALEQDRVFSSSNGRRVVLATNVAETSLTVPGIRYVIDTGLARVKRYRYRSKVEQLQIEPISQAAADQRAGRCGRVADGVCVRLYDEADYAARPRYTDPEVLRSSLAAVILRMKALRLADVESFPFLDAPPRKAIADGYALLHELAAVDERNALSEVGRHLARLPVDPRIGRMLLAARDAQCLREVLVIAAALSAQDPRERPMDRQQAADAQHRRFADEQSDFVSFVKLWDYWQDAQAQRAARGESHRQLAARIEREFLSIRKLREWADVHAQLVDTVAELRWRTSATPAPYDAVHRALLTGLLGNLGTKAPEEPTYAGTHGTRFAIHPSSWLTKKPPRWLMAAEMVDTGRLYARTVARIDPAWIEKAAAHLVQRSWTDPVWSRNAAQVVAFERGTLYGLTIYAQRRVPYAAHDPALAREVLIREALVQGDWLDAPQRRKLPFLEHNRRLVADIHKLEDKIRRPDLLVDEQFLHDWFDARVPCDVTTGAALEAWYARASADDPELLKLSRDEVLRKESGALTSDAFPRRLSMRGTPFELDYRFDPGTSDDGVTMTVPLWALSQVDAQRCEWLVPGMLRDKVTALLKSLPQRLRRHLVPLPETVDAFCEAWRERAGERALVDALIETLREQHGVRVAASDFRPEAVPPHLHLNFKLVDEHGGFVAASRHLAQLRAEHGQRAQGAFQQALSSVAARLSGADAAPPPAAPPRAAAVSPDAGASVPPHDSGAHTDGGTGARSAAASDADAAATARLAGSRFVDWRFGRLPEIMELQQPGRGPRATLIGYPALVDAGDAVELQVYDEPAHAAREHRAGLRRLFALALAEPLRFHARHIPDAQRLSLLYLPFGGTDDLKTDLVAAVIERTCLQPPLPDDEATFRERVAQARPRLNLVGQELARLAAEILAEHQQVVRKLAASRIHAQAVADIEQQLQALLPPHFLARTPPERLAHFPRYLRAITLRLEKLRADPARDAQKTAEIAPLQQSLRRALAQRRGEPDPRLDEFRWLLEELRVSLYAQELRTPTPVSVKRLHKAWQALAA